MPDQTEKVTASYVYRYSNELVVELTGEDPDGDLVVRSYQFAFDGEGVTPKTTVEDGFQAYVADALADEGYDWETG